MKKTLVAIALALCAALVSAPVASAGGLVSVTARIADSKIFEHMYVNETGSKAVKLVKLSSVTCLLTKNGSTYATANLTSDHPSYEFGKLRFEDGDHYKLTVTYYDNNNDTLFSTDMDVVHWPGEHKHVTVNIGDQKHTYSEPMVTWPSFSPAEDSNGKNSANINCAITVEVPDRNMFNETWYDPDRGRMAKLESILCGVSKSVDPQSEQHYAYLTANNKSHTFVLNKKSEAAGRLLSIQYYDAQNRLLNFKRVTLPTGAIVAKATVKLYSVEKDYYTPEISNPFK